MITPLVSGIVVLLIGLSLIKVGIVSCGGGYAAVSYTHLAKIMLPYSFII